MYMYQSIQLQNLSSYVIDLERLIRRLFRELVETLENVVKLDNQELMWVYTKMVLLFKVFAFSSESTVV